MQLEPGNLKPLNSPKVWGWLLVLFFASALQDCSFAQKTDTILLTNGSKIVGEIRQMRFNSLSVKTTPMQTISIKWYTVKGIISRDKVYIYSVKVDARHETELYGSLDTSSRDGYLKIVTVTGPVEYHRSQVSELIQVKQKFWGKFSGNIGIGATYTKSSNIWQLNVDGGLTYNSKKFLSQLTFSSVRTNQQDTITTAKTDVTSNSFFYLNANWYVVGYLGFNKNTELGIDQRYYFGTGIARLLLTSANIRLFSSIGAIRTFEVSTDTESSNNYEGTIQLDFRIFKNSDPEISVSSMLKYYPSFTIPGRNRVEYDLDFNVEVINNLYIGATFYYNFDSKPAENALSTNDYGFTTKLSYKFGL